MNELLYLYKLEATSIVRANDTDQTPSWFYFNNSNIGSEWPAPCDMGMKQSWSL